MDFLTTTRFANKILLISYKYNYTENVFFLWQQFQKFSDSIIIQNFSCGVDGAGILILHIIVIVPTIVNDSEI